jgi:serine/threonine-protein kinase HipA
VNRRGIVYVQAEPAGIIEEFDAGFRFSYFDAYLARAGASPVSFTLPLRSEPYEERFLFPFFDGLIPEGWLLSITEKNWKIDRRDRMGLLLSVCGDCIGDVSIRPDTEAK